MTIEAVISAALEALAPGNVFPDFAPEGTDRPFITYQAIGGQPINYTTSDIPDKENTRVQVNVWADSRMAASSLSKQVEIALRTLSVQSEVLTGRTSTFDEDTGYRGTMQDFSFWM